MEPLGIDRAIPMPKLHAIALFGVPVGTLVYLDPDRGKTFIDSIAVIGS